MIRSARFLIVPIGVALVALLIAWNPQPRQAHALFNDSDGDTVSDLSEVVTGSDPHNANSTPEDTGAAFVSGLPLCSDGRDNDGDGLTDAADPGCQDSDGDIISNAMETLLGSNPNNGSSFPEDSRFDAVAAQAGFPLNTCADGRDGDLDGLIDAADPGCAPINNDGDAFDDSTEKRFGSDPGNANSVPEHELANPGSCSDGIDNDLDGLTDAADPACRPLANDSYASATAISALPYADAEKMTSATSDRGEPYASCSFGSAPATVWYQYTPSQDGVLVADTTGSDFQNVVAVWRQDGSALREVACASSNLGRAAQSRTAFRVTGGQTYKFQIGGYLSPDQPANLSFHLRLGAASVNDSFLGAETIPALPFSASADTADATTEFGEPSCYGLPASTLWYRFVPAQDQLVMLTAEGSSAAGLPAVSVWTPTPFGLFTVACASGGQPSQRLAFQASGGQTYYIQVGAYPYGPAPGAVTIDLQVGVPPPNDNFASATAVSALPYDNTVDMLTATGEAFEPSPSCSYGGSAGATVWYRYTATSNGYLAANASSGFSTVVVGVYQGTSLADLSEVACNNAYAPEGRLGFAVTAGHTYYIQLSNQRSGPPPVPGPVPAPGPGAAAPVPGPVPPGPPLDPSEVAFHLEALTVPSCAPPDVTLSDPVGDATSFGGPLPAPSQPPVDITSVASGSDSRNLCLQVRYVDPLPAPDPRNGPYASADIGFDIDGNPSTGYSSGPCSAGGIDRDIYISMPSGILVPIYPFSVFVEPGAPPSPPEELYAFALFEDRSFKLIIPLDALGGQRSVRFSVSINSGGGFDCAPNGAPPPPPPPTPGPPGAPGDPSCDGLVNAIDSALILQLGAGLIPTLPCSVAGDVNDSGDVSAVDATLILQFSSGMIAALPSRG